MAACSSEGGSLATTSPPDTIVQVRDTVAATTTTTEVPTTTSMSTTTTTTLPETTTTIATEDLIKQAVQDYIAAYFACGQAPDHCDPTAFTAEQGPSRVAITQLISGMRAHGLYFGADVRGSYIVAESISPDSAVEATATYCAFDALIVLGPNGPDGQPTVVNDAVSSSRYTYKVFVEHGAWIVGEQEQIERLGEGNLCPAA